MSEFHIGNPILDKIDMYGVCFIFYLRLQLCMMPSDGTSPQFKMLISVLQQPGQLSRLFLVLNKNRS